MQMEEVYAFPVCPAFAEHIVGGAYYHKRVSWPKYPNVGHATRQLLTWTGMLLSRRTIAFPGFLVCGPLHLAMQFDRVYVRRLVVMLVVHTLHAPLPTR